MEDPNWLFERGSHFVTLTDLELMCKVGWPQICDCPLHVLLKCCDYSDCHYACL